MNMQRFNWQILAGFLLSVAAFITYPFLFAKFPLTRDFPWANLLLFLVAAVLLFIGIRRAFAPDRRRRSKIAASLLTTLSVLILAFFVFSVFVMARWIPASKGAPQIGQKAPDFNLTDSNGKLTSLSELLSSPIGATPGRAVTPAGTNRNPQTPPKGVLLIFYRGYW